jgi:hypothetical protein
MGMVDYGKINTPLESLLRVQNVINKDKRKVERRTPQVAISPGNCDHGRLIFTVSPSAGDVKFHGEPAVSFRSDQ